MPSSTESFEATLRSVLCERADTVPFEVAQRQLDRFSDHARSSRNRQGRPRWREPAVILVAVVAVLLAIALPSVLLQQQDEPANQLASERAAEAIEGLSGSTLQGRSVDVADYRGAPLLITAWGSWCEACVEQLSGVRDIANKTGIQVLGINARDRHKTAVAFETRYRLPFESIEDQSGFLVKKFLGAEYGYPGTWLLDSEGRVIETWLGITTDWGPVIAATNEEGMFNPRSVPPVGLTCISNQRVVGAPPFRDVSTGGAATPGEAVEAWLKSPLSGNFYGPDLDFILEDSMNRAWILRDDGRAGARVDLKLEAGGYFVDTYEACPTTGITGADPETIPAL